MKAVVVENYTAIDQIVVKEVPMPDLSPGLVRVRVRAVGIGFVDGLKVQGLYQTKDPLPFIPGTEFAGEVEAAADGVAGYPPGTPVMGMMRSGALAEYVLVPPEALHRLPDGVSAEAGASFRANYLTAHYSLTERACLRAGEQLLVLGAAGGVGTAAIQLGKIFGARVIAAASTEDKRHFALELGADAVVDYTRADWRNELKDLTGGHGCDVIVDPVGGPVSLEAFRSIAWNGRHLVIGFASGSIPALPFNLPLLKGATLMGVDLAQVSRREPEAYLRVTSDLFRLLSERRLQPAVGQVFDLVDFRDAFNTLACRQALGKVVVRV
ncbi:NADPH:quinone oxidoreductase family protein [Rhodopseudomonas sp. P2A-2r]|uniref:NADPH:quinone oxidoreductase family protein n=1 Tax=unclassified Rhodopseudomonas TaxID=2638247 RepID=UPI002234E4B7|nr:NADPH:quinone oxidoreductase family protein [Rhodopseudomonas sp. P2A-2r]UZE47874.1 NADPH:quinone oxidoreductase family protein [Rhodopseudomonas sp. P2A-2r]